MQWVEVTGRTVEEAKEAALDQLGVDEQDAEFEILEEPKSGLFGRLRSEARVRARVVPTEPRPKVDRRERRRGSREGRGGGGGGGGRSGGGGQPGGGRQPRRTEQQSETRSSGRKGQTAVTTEQADAQVEPPSLAEEADAAEAEYKHAVALKPDDARLRARAVRVGAGGTRLVAAVRSLPKQPLGHHAAAAVPDAHEEDVAHAGDSFRMN